MREPLEHRSRDDHARRKTNQQALWCNEAIELSGLAIVAGEDAQVGIGIDRLHDCLQRGREEIICHEYDWSPHDLSPGVRDAKRQRLV